MGISQTDRCVGPRHSGEEMAHRAVGPGVTPSPTPGEREQACFDDGVIGALHPFPWSLGPES